MEIGVVVCLNLGIIGDILKMADNFVGQIMGVQKFMPVGNRMPGEDGIEDFCQLPFTVFRIIGLLRGKTRILCYVRTRRNAGNPQWPGKATRRLNPGKYCCRRGCNYSGHAGICAR